MESGKAQALEVLDRISEFSFQTTNSISKAFIDFETEIGLALGLTEVEIIENAVRRIEGYKGTVAEVIPFRRP